MAKGKKTQTWAPGNLFVVKQRDGICSLGQVLDVMMKNVVSCAFFDIRVPCESAHGQYDLNPGRLIAVLSVSREQLDYGKWRVVGSQEVTLARELWPNEEHRGRLWVGAKVHDASIAEELLDAYNGLVPWDDWHDPAYLDTLLAHPDRKPKHVIYRRR